MQNAECRMQNAEGRCLHSEFCILNYAGQYFTFSTKAVSS